MAVSNGSNGDVVVAEDELAAGEEELAAAELKTTE